MENQYMFFFIIYNFVAASKFKDVDFIGHLDNKTKGSNEKVTPKST